MRVLIAVGRFHEDERGGAYRIAADCAYELRDRGDDVTLLCEGLAGAPEIEEREGVRLLRYKQASAPTPYERHAKSASAALRWHMQEPPDLIWGHSPFQFLIAVDAFPQSQCSYVVHSPLSLEMLSRHDPPQLADRIKSALGKRMERRCLERAQVVQTLSRFTRDTILRLHGGSFENKVVVTPGWADTRVFRPVQDKFAM
ncbi:MAG: glycosyltransferase, partial [Acidobacteriales bacterium]|nr:glycosyltransferase [Terriglobales bacterium]